jgi:hypothetical protein
MDQDKPTVFETEAEKAGIELKNEAFNVTIDREAEKKLVRKVSAEPSQCWITSIVGPD